MRCRLRFSWWLAERRRCTWDRRQISYRRCILARPYIANHSIRCQPPRVRNVRFRGAGRADRITGMGAERPIARSARNGCYPAIHPLRSFIGDLANGRGRPKSVIRASCQAIQESGIQHRLARTAVRHGGRSGPPRRRSNADVSQQVAVAGQMSAAVGRADHQDGA